MSLLVAIFSLTSAILILLVVLYGFRSGAFNLTASFAGLALIDIYLPSILWGVQDEIRNYPFASHIGPDDIGRAVLFYTLFYVLFLMVLLASSRVSQPSVHLPANLIRLKTKLFWMALFFCSFSVLSLYLEVQSMGGWVLWLSSKFVRSKKWIDGAPSGVTALILTIPFSYAFQAVAGAAFCLRKTRGYEWFFTYFFPSFALAFALLSFLRGTILICLLTFLFAELFRIRYLNNHSFEARKTGQKLSNRKSIKKLRGYSIAALLFVFVIYGGVRDNLRAADVGLESSRSFTLVPAFLEDGHGLISLSNIMVHYRDADERLLGKTYVDMLLLPVPRFLYQSKPAWYGIDDIAAGMNWPSSTQSAATMPGEAYANFGSIGLVLAVVLGGFLGRARSFIFRSPVRFVIIGPVLFVTIPLSMNWMSFTGLMNNFFFVCLLIFICGILENRLMIHQGRIRVQRLG